MYRKVELKDGYVGMEKKVAKLWEEKDVIKKLLQNDIFVKQMMLHFQGIVINVLHMQEPTYKCRFLHVKLRYWEVFPTRLFRGWVPGKGEKNLGQAFLYI